MALRHRPALVSALLACLTPGVVGCGPGRGAPDWIAADAAEIRCTVSGKQRIQPILAAVPTPPVPPGLYARQLDPMALDGLGYQRNQPACATLLPPTEAELEAAGPSLDELLAVHQVVGEQATRVAGPCVCEVAGELGAISIIQQCFGASVRRHCEVTEDRVDAVRAELAPLAAAAQAASIPVTHWRISGVTDRPGWFLRRQSSLVALYPRGSDIYPRGTAVSDATDMALVAALLQADDVTAVVRQNVGQSLLVVREIDDVLVLDHFTYPEVAGHRVGLVRYWESLHIDDFMARLARPTEALTPMVDGRRGNFVELWIPALERVDVGKILASKLSPEPYRVADEERSEPAVLVDRVVVQAPFGTDGKVLEGEIRFNPAGVEWALLLEGEVLSPRLEELQPEDPISFTPPEDVRKPPAFLLRGTGTNQVWVHGLRAVSRPLARMEMESPGTINGGLETFELKLPGGLPPGLVVDPVLKKLAAWLQREAQGVTGGFARDRTRVLFRLGPR